MDKSAGRKMEKNDIRLAVSKSFTRLTECQRWVKEGQINNPVELGEDEKLHEIYPPLAAFAL